MNKKLKIFLATGLIAASTFTLVGCVNNSDKAVKQNSKNEEQVGKQEDSKEENKDTENKDKDKDKDSKKEDPKKNNDAKNEDSSGKKSITYYTYDVDSEKLKEHTKPSGEISVGNVIDALVNEGILQKGTKVNKAKVEEMNGVRTLVVDVNSKFVNFDQGSTQELLQLKSFADSLMKTFKVKQVLLTVEGKPYSGGHIAFNEGEMLTFK